MGFATPHTASVSSLRLFELDVKAPAPARRDDRLAVPQVRRVRLARPGQPLLPVPTPGERAGELHVLVLVL